MFELFIKDTPEDFIKKIKKMANKEEIAVPILICFSLKKLELTQDDGNNYSVELGTSITKSEGIVFDILKKLPLQSRKKMLKEIKEILSV